MLHDPETYSQPEIFNPDRFIASEKNAAEMMRTRVKAVDLPGYRDLSSYLVSVVLFMRYKSYAPCTD